MITQSFLYNAIFFTSGLVLEFYFHVNPTDTGYYFFASAGASAGYLTASEVFPHLIGDGSNRNTLFAGYIVGAGAMILGGVVAIFFGVAAEGKSLEDVATPLSVVSKPPQTIFRSGVDREGVDPAAP